MTRGRFALVVLGALFGLAFSARAEASPEVDRGNALLRSRGCVACHSTDGTPRTGPSFRGLWGRSRPVEVGPAGAGKVQDVVVDEAYLARALREPDAEIAAGYPRGNMPRFAASDEDVHALAAALRAIDEAPGNVASSGARGGSILPLALAAAAFAALHFLLSAIPVRKRLSGALKQGGF